MKIQVSALVGLFAAVSPLLSTPASASTLLGVYAGNQGWDMPTVSVMESWQGRRHAVVNLFSSWCNSSTDMNNLFNSQLPNVWGNANIPMITWEPYLCGGASSTPSDIELRIALGDYDPYISAWAGRLKTFLSGVDGVYGTADDRRAYLRFAHEMNGNWYPWSAAGAAESPSDYVAMWQRAQSLFDGLGLDASRLQWVWAVNNADVGPYPAEAYFPGDAYVDWIGMDGYNWGYGTGSSWTTPEQVYDPMLSRLSALSAAPVTISEAASTTQTSSGVDLAAKSQWITDFFGYVLNRQLEMVSWFNEDKEKDWAVFGGVNGDVRYKVGKKTYKAYSSYKTAVGSAGIVSSDPANPRLITDTQFAGF